MGAAPVCCYTDPDAFSIECADTVMSYRGEAQYDGRWRGYTTSFFSASEPTFLEWLPAPMAAEGIEDFSGNPVLQAPGWVDWVVGDPCVLRIDDEIHLWTNGALADIQHWVAHVDDPTSFRRLEDSVSGFGTARPYAFHDKAKNTVTLFYEKYDFPHLTNSRVLCREADVGSWSFCSSEALLEPELPWEKSGCARMGSPFVFYNAMKKKYWLYYSAGRVRLADSGVEEPALIGLAESDSLHGPYTRVLQDPVSIDGSIPGKSVLGHSSLKVLRHKGEFIDEAGTGVALCNRTCVDLETQHTSSVISLVCTFDGGLSWQTVITNFIGPTGQDNSWKKAYVYAFDTIPDFQDACKELIYYSARSGYKDSFEQVGLSRFSTDILEIARTSATVPNQIRGAHLGL